MSEEIQGFGHQLGLKGWREIRSLITLSGRAFGEEPFWMPGIPASHPPAGRGRFAAILATCRPTRAAFEDGSEYTEQTQRTAQRPLTPAPRLRPRTRFARSRLWS